MISWKITLRGITIFNEKNIPKGEVVRRILFERDLDYAANYYSH